MKSNATFYSRYVSTHYKHIAPVTTDSFRKRFYVWKSYLSSLLPANKQSYILEIGAGVGHNLYALKELGYVNTLGTDFSPECVKICKSQGFSVRLVNDKTEQSFYKTQKGKFDVVILYDVLEHYSPLEAAKILIEVKDMLRPDGLVLLSLPNASHPLSNSLFFADITHKFIYTEMSLSQLLRNSGFTQIKFLQINSFTLYDDSILIRFIKLTLLRGISVFGEIFWRLVALSQGIVLPACKPTLIAVARI